MYLNGNAQKKLEQLSGCDSNQKLKLKGIAISEFISGKIKELHPSVITRDEYSELTLLVRIGENGWAHTLDRALYKQTSRVKHHVLSGLSKILNAPVSEIADEIPSATTNVLTTDSNNNYIFGSEVSYSRPHFNDISSSDLLCFRTRLAELIKDAKEEIVWVKREFLAPVNAREDGRNFDLDPEYKSIYEVIFLLLAAMKGLHNSKGHRKVKVNFIYYAEQSVIGNKHLCFLYGLGVNIIIKKIADGVPFEGIIADPNRNESAKMIFRNPEQYSKAHDCKYLFFDEKSQAIIKHFYAHTEKILKENPPADDFVASVKNYKTLDKYFNKLSFVDGYGLATFKLIPDLKKWLAINHRKVFAHQSSIKRHKLIQLEATQFVMKHDRAEVTLPSYLQLRPDKNQEPRYKVINPPIFEKRSEFWHLIDGSTRTYFAATMDNEYAHKIAAVEVIGCSRHLPTDKPTPLDSIINLGEGAIKDSGSDHEIGRIENARQVDKYTFDVHDWTEWYSDFFQRKMNETNSGMKDDKKMTSQQLIKSNKVANKTKSKRK